MLEASMGHLRHQRNVGVDPDAPEVQGTSHPHGASVVVSPHAGGETVFDAIGPFESLGLVVEALHRDHRPEDLALNEIVILADPGDDGRLVEVAAVTDTVPSRNHIRMRGCAFDELANPLELPGVA